MSLMLQRYLAVLCLGCLAFTLFSIALSDGGQKIPWDVPDSRGQVFSFNDPMSGEHFAIGMRRVTLRGSLQEAGWYGTSLVGMQVLGLAMLSLQTSSRRKIIRAFFALQLALFPWGWVAMLGIPWVFFEGIDAETLMDGPPFWWWSQGLWTPVSGTVVLYLKPIGEASRFKPPAILERIRNRLNPPQPAGLQPSGKLSPPPPPPERPCRPES